MPLLTRDHTIAQKTLYYAPYLTSKIVAETQIPSSALLKFAIGIDTNDVRPALIFDAIHNPTEQKSTFSIAPIGNVDSVHDFEKPIIAELMDDIARESCIGASHAPRRTAECLPDAAPCPCSPAPAPRYRMLRISDDTAEPSRKERFTRRLLSTLSTDEEENCPTLNEIEDDTLSLMETQRILHELQTNVQRLRLQGISLMAIHEFIDSQEKLSPMVITEDYRIFLPEYNNTEIEMGTLPKALYFLFLRYSEGIVCKHMPDHYSELLGIYRQLRPKTDEARLNLTITKVVNPLGNALNENIARIRKAFVEKFDEHLAANYIITGERAKHYAIPLDRTLITWEE